MFCNSNLPETRDGRLIQANPWGPWAPVATLPMPNAPMGASYTTWRDTSSKLAAEAPDLMAGEIEVDESYFGGVRKGKRDRGAAGKVPVFGLLKRGGKVYAVTIPNARTETLLPIIESKIRPDSIVYTDSFRAYDVLDVSDFHHVRINHSKLFAEDRNHINGIENFWNQAKRHMSRYNGIPKQHFHLYLKECEWRFNYRPTANLLKVLVEWAKI